MPYLFNIFTSFRNYGLNGRGGVRRTPGQPRRGGKMGKRPAIEALEVEVYVTRISTANILETMRDWENLTIAID